MTTPEYLVCIFGMALVTALPRLLPLTLLAGRSLPPGLVRCLSFVPAAVLAALLAPELFLRDATLAFSSDNLFLLAAIPTFLVSWKTQSFFGAIATGMVAVALGRFIGW